MKRPLSLWLKASFALFAVSVVGATVAAFSLASYEPGTKERCTELGNLLSSNQYTSADRIEYSKYCGQLPQMYPVYPATPSGQSTFCDDLRKIMDSGQYSADQKAQWANCPQGVPTTQPLYTCDDLKRLIESGSYTSYEKEQWANCEAGKSGVQPTAPAYTCDEIKKIIDSGNYNSDQKLLWLNCQQGYQPVPKPSITTDMYSQCQDLMAKIKKYSVDTASVEYQNAKADYNKLCGGGAGTIQPATPYFTCDELKKIIESGNYAYDQKQHYLTNCQQTTPAPQPTTTAPTYNCDDLKIIMDSGKYTYEQKWQWMRCGQGSTTVGGQTPPAIGDQMREECERLRVTLEKYSANPDSQEYADTKAKYVKTCYRQEQNVRTPQVMPTTTTTQRPVDFVREDDQCKLLRAKMNAMSNAGQANTQDYFNLKDSFKKQCEKANALPPAGFEEVVLTNPDTYSNPFPDTNINDRQGKAAAELYRRGVLGGFPDGEFKGNKPVNRAEAAKFLLLACGKDTQADYSGKFRDLMKGQWYVPYVEAAASQGIINGYADGTFRPANTVNRAEFSKMITLACQLPADLDHSLFTDVKDGDWFATYSGAVQKFSLYPDSVVDNLFKPANLMTRSEVAIAIFQYLTNR